MMQKEQDLDTTGWKVRDFDPKEDALLDPEVLEGLRQTVSDGTKVFVFRIRSLVYKTLVKETEHRDHLILVNAYTGDSFNVVVDSFLVGFWFASGGNLGGILQVGDTV